jgi:hypothetical protein
MEEGTRASLVALDIFDAEGKEDLAARALVQMTEHIGLNKLPQVLQERIVLLVDDGLKANDILIRTWAQREKAYQLAKEDNFERASTLLEEIVSTYPTVLATSHIRSKSGSKQSCRKPQQHSSDA